MRCPKCGYISFDHLENCLKCNKNIEAISDGLFGSTYNIQAPTFLQLHRKQREEPSEQGDLFGEQSSADVDEYVDEDLKILVEEEASDVEGEIGFAEKEQVGLELSLEDEQEEDGEIEIDFSQFEDADDHEVAQHSMAIEMPEELSDISDLSPPGKDIEVDERPSENPMDSDFADLDLGDLDFDSGMDGLDEDQANGLGMLEEAVLTLDEIDFTETLAESSSGSSKKLGNMDMDMDEDLDFDLDLGGLSIHKDF